METLIGRSGGSTGTTLRRANQPRMHSSESFNSRLRDECLNEHLFLSFSRGPRNHRSLALFSQSMSPTFELAALTPSEFVQLKSQILIPPSARKMIT